MASSHFDADGRAQMVDITRKDVSPRVAIASAVVEMQRRAAEQIRDASAKKGDVLGIARIAGIGATKWTPMLIPLCHGIPIEQASVEFRWLDDPSPDVADSREDLAHLQVRTHVCTTSKTGVEMEALTAASIAALTVIDMLKSVDRAMVVRHIRVEHKSGGQSGTFNAVGSDLDAR